MEKSRFQGEKPNYFDPFNVNEKAPFKGFFYAWKNEIMKPEKLKLINS